MSQAAYDGLRWAVFVLLLLGGVTIVQGRKIMNLTKEKTVAVAKGRYS